ncbi:hypothetical protein CHARACLAT_021227 [Characodon lateralis]|uniref:Uncharacterized protein n=1 Tax=Characodon lateralis TaxID=208331 RepID=A0ABU7CU50_9TELE|nr:hypothetical protein [Characodon lateralis]
MDTHFLIRDTTVHFSTLLGSSRGKVLLAQRDWVTSATKAAPCQLLHKLKKDFAQTPGSLTMDTVFTFSAMQSHGPMLRESVEKREVTS